MNRRAMDYLADMGGICAHSVGRSKMCLLEPGHDGECSDRFPHESPTREQRLMRDIAKLKAQRDRRQRHREHLVVLVRRLEDQRDRDRAYIGFRIEYRIRGGLNRLRRYRRMAWNRTVRRALGTWPPT